MPPTPKTPPASAISSAAAPSATPSRSGGADARGWSRMSAMPTAIRASGARATARPMSRRSPSSSHPPTGPMPKPRKSVTPGRWPAPRAPGRRARGSGPSGRRAAGAGALAWRDGDGGCGVRAGCRWLPPGSGRAGPSAAGIPPEGDTPPGGPFLPRRAAAGRGPLGSRGPAAVQRRPDRAPRGTPPGLGDAQAGQDPQAGRDLAPSRWRPTGASTRRTSRSTTR